jgi:hypothetical protein
VGANISWGARLVRLRLLLKGRFRAWTDENVRALQSIRPLLTDDSRSVLDDFDQSRHGTLWRRISGLWIAGVYRQTILGNLGLVAAAILRKL